MGAAGTNLYQISPIPQLAVDICKHLYKSQLLQLIAHAGSISPNLVKYHFI